ncbi:hypothetical protein OAD98_01330 [Flavobacteriales bacterium]|nr:hypothetical protein [Flavobacteriales bacterium]MDG1175256.1 hypothetical protein [Flavobacteriales bacterium]
MKYTYLLASLLFMASGGTESTTMETTAEQETTPQVVEENTITDKLLGTWEFEDTSLNITQVITYQEDGTYQMKMGSMDINGTWKLTDDVLITKSRPDSDGQKKTIIKLTQDSLCTFWEPKGGNARNMNYLRSK